MTSISVAIPAYTARRFAIGTNVGRQWTLSDVTATRLGLSLPFLTLELQFKRRGVGGSSLAAPPG